MYTVRPELYRDSCYIVQSGSVYARWSVINRHRLYYVGSRGLRYIYKKKEKKVIKSNVILAARKIDRFERMA